MNYDMSDMSLNKDDPESLFNWGRWFVRASKEDEMNANKYLSIAVKLFLRAAKLGHTESQYNLGLCYFDGCGIGQDYETSFDWFMKAAEQGHIGGQHRVGMCYLEGDGVGRDFVQAVMWFEKASEQGSPISQYNLGLCYENGWGGCER